MEPIRIDAFRNRDAILKIAEMIRKKSRRPVRLMEVCGGHTAAIHRFGLAMLLPETVELLSGPGCPVCVSSQQYLDGCVWLSRQPGVIIATYGDLIRVPASESSLEKERAMGGDVRIVYSVTEALSLAMRHRDRDVVFLGIGFETTAPSSAYAIREASRQDLVNFFLFSAHKIMPPALRALADDKLRIDGFIAPGHVSAVTGTGIYNFLPDEFDKGVVVSGFEPLDIMQSVFSLIRMAESGVPSVENQYRRVVRHEGNTKAQALIDETFERADDNWRGLGKIPLSGLQIRSGYNSYDARNRFSIPDPGSKEPEGCKCGEILKGLTRPCDCPLFGSMCTPGNPVGACMVSGEGSCAISFKYNRN